MNTTAYFRMMALAWCAGLIFASAGCGQTKEAADDAADDAEVPGDVVDAGDATESDATDDTMDVTACRTPIPLPVSAELLVAGVADGPRRFADSGFVMDAQGNMVGVDANGNVVRRAGDGSLSVWVEKAVKAGRGVAWLSTGELVIADSGRGMLVKVYAGGEVRILTRHLDFPDGVVVGDDDSIYVAEASRGAVVKVNPETGEYETLFSGLRVAPYGLAISADGRTIYIAGHGNGTVYFIHRGDDGTWSAPLKYARIPGIAAPCDDVTVGTPCEVDGETGTCQPMYTDSDELFCMADGPCFGLSEGDACTDDYFSGICKTDDYGELYCSQVGACDGKVAGDECVDWDIEGICVDDGFGDLYCQEVGPCENKQAGDKCLSDDHEGVCQVDEWGSWRCRLPNVCDTLSSGAECIVNGTTGVCADDGWNGLECTYQDPCPGLAAGASCVTAEGLKGECAGDGEFSYCSEIPACRGIVAGDPCQEGDLDGVCADDLNGDKTCQTSGVCETSNVNDPCTDSTTYRSGTCLPTNDGSGLYCLPENPCSGAAVGDKCQPEYYYASSDAGRLENKMVLLAGGGRCELSAESMMYCAPVYSCDGMQEGDGCTTEWGTKGSCILFDGDGLYCQEDSPGPCDYLSVGDACVTSDGADGVCADDGSGYLVCITDWPCSGAAVGDVCKTLNSLDGVCEDDGSGTLYCKPDPACAEGDVGNDCIDVATTLPGKCVSTSGNELVCQPLSPCAGMNGGESCQGRGGVTGVCKDWGMGGELTCETAETAGFLNGITVDACGNVYVGDDKSDTVWRISSDGATVVPAARVWTSGVSSLVWGAGAGGFEKGALYAVTGGGEGLSRFVPGVPAGTLVMPAGQPVQPEGQAWQPEIDCMNIPSKPLSIESLDAPRGFHDVAFDEDGYVVGYDGSNLIRVNRQDAIEVYAMGLGTVQGMDWLKDGSLVVASDVGVVKIEPTGAQVILAADIFGYGVTVGPDNKVYVGDNDKLYRIDPETRDVLIYLDPSRTPPDSGELLPRTVGFDLDASIMYIGSNSESLFVLTLDKDLNPVGWPRQFSVVKEGASYLDGLGVDACGNVFIPNYESSALYRVSPDGITSLFLQQDNVSYGHGLDWGNGIGDWKADALYLPQPYNENHVIEISIGVGKNHVTGVK